MNNLFDCARFDVVDRINANEHRVIIYVHSPLNASYFASVCERLCGFYWRLVSRKLALWLSKPEARTTPTDSIQAHRAIGRLCLDHAMLIVSFTASWRRRCRHRRSRPRRCSPGP